MQTWSDRTDWRKHTYSYRAKSSINVLHEDFRGITFDWVYTVPQMQDFDKVTGGIQAATKTERHMGVKMVDYRIFWGDNLVDSTL